MKRDITNIYCDESHPIQNDGQDFMIIGALICPKRDYKDIKKDIQSIKKMYGLDLNYEFKWQKVIKRRYDAYVALLDYIASSTILRLKINVSLGKNLLRFYDSKKGYSNWYHKMYVNMLKNYLCLHEVGQNEMHFDLYIDRKETISDKKYEKIAKSLKKKFKYSKPNYSFSAVACDSKEFLLIQCVDVIIGAISYFQKKQYVNKYKAMLMKHLVNVFKLNLDEQITKDSDKASIFYWHPDVRL